MKQKPKRRQSIMKHEQNIKIQIEYGNANLKQILLELLKEQYISYITINKK